MKLQHLLLAFLVCLPLSLSAKLSEAELYANVAYFGYESARLEKEVLDCTKEFVSQLFLLLNITNDVYNPHWIGELNTSLGKLKTSLEQRAKIVHIWQVCTQYADEFAVSPEVETLRVNGQQILHNESVALWNSVSELIKQQNAYIDQKQAEVQNTTNALQRLADGAICFDCDTTMQPLAQLAHARTLGSQMIHQGLALMQFGTTITVQLNQIFNAAMHYFKENYNTLIVKNSQKKFFLLFDQKGLIPEEDRTVILPTFLGEAE